MSSILDALKKLEAEKTARLGESRPVPFRKETAEELLVASPAEAEPDEPTGSRWIMLGGLAAFALILIAISITASVIALNNEDKREQVAAATPGAPLQATVAPIAPAGAPAAPAADLPGTAPVVGTPELTTPTPMPAAEAPTTLPPATQAVTPPPVAPVVAVPEPEEETPGPETPEKAPPVAEVAPKRPAPKPPVVVAKAPAVQIDPPVEEVQEVADDAEEEEKEEEEADDEAPPSTPMEPVDVKLLQDLRPSDRKAFGLDNITINMLREVSDERPYGLAIINLNKVVVGEKIPETKVRLIGVTRQGIAIEDTKTGQRFFMRNYSR